MPIGGTGPSRITHQPWLATAILTISVFAASLLMRLPTRSAYIVNWDGVQFALATRGFDLAGHRPHPPGYPGYVLAGRILNHFTGDPNTSFVLMSLLAGALAPALFLLFARQIFDRERAVAITVLFAASPLLWYYSGVALTYAVEAALAVAFGSVAWNARRKQGTWTVCLSMTLALVGAVRPTGAILLFPLWVWAVFPGGARLRLQALATLVVASLLWLLPLLWLAGGLASYLRETAVLADHSGSSTSILSGNVTGIARNWALAIASLLAALGGALVLVLLVLVRGRVPSPGRCPIEPGFLLSWILPGLLVFLFVHIGQPGYVLVITPPLFLAIGALWPAGGIAIRSLAVPGLGVLLAANSWMALRAPAELYRSLPPQSSLAGYVRQYAPAANDAHWAQLIRFADLFDPRSTVILTAPGGPRSSGSFRHAAYYLNDYHVYAAGWIDRSTFGHLYSAFEGRDNYSIDGALEARPVLALPPGVNRILIPDEEIAVAFASSLELDPYPLAGGGVVWVAEVEPNTVLAFHGGTAGPVVEVFVASLEQAPLWFA